MEQPASRGSTPLTTFVRADASTFRELVQRLTGPSSAGDPQTSTGPQPKEAANEVAVLKVVGVKRPTFKLHERRQCMRSKLEIIKPSFQFKPGSLVPLTSGPVFSPSRSGNSGFTTSPLNTPSKTFSNLSILGEEKENPASSDLISKEEEEKAIKERRFYLHPSPRSRPGNVEPELLTLFPLTSPKTHES